VFSLDADFFEHPDVPMDSGAETARVDAERLAHVYKREWSIVVFGVNPV
jgi:hypothetical protein